MFYNMTALVVLEALFKDLDVDYGEFLSNVTDIRAIDKCRQLYASTSDGRIICLLKSVSLCCW